MTLPRTRKPFTVKNSIAAAVAGLILLALLAVVVWFWWGTTVRVKPYKFVSTVAGTGGEFGEPFGIAVRGNDVFVTDGQNDQIWRISDGKATVFAAGLDTPSGIAFTKNGDLIVADSGSHTIKSVNAKGEVTVIAGVNGKQGFADSDATIALFNAPVGIAVGADGRVFVADTYNDRIRVIDNGKVTTLSGSGKGYADGVGDQAKFDTPTGIAVWQDKLLISDAGNRRIRVVEPTGIVWTLAGNGEQNLKDGLLSTALFVQPTAISVNKSGQIYIADGNAIRMISGEVLPIVQTISADERGLSDGNLHRSRFNRPSGLAFDAAGNLLVADSENRLVRNILPQNNDTAITKEQIAALRDKPEEFRQLQPARWPYDPPTAKRDIAGTLGEIRGEMKPGSDQVWYHNGLDIAGAYGETARFVRDEKVLRPIAAENFGTLRELIRMPTLGYIHIRLGRNVESVPFGDGRFQFEKETSGKLSGVRVPRGAKFKAGEPIGTLNAMNHVHLIAGRSGSEMNALDALTLPGLTDSRPPTIENVTLFDKNWSEIETAKKNQRITLRDQTRIVVRAYDQADGNSEKRRLGVFKLGYQLLKQDGSAVADTKWTIVFDRLPSAASISLVYANGSKSGATGETIFNYIVTNSVSGDEFHEDVFDAATLASGIYTLRVFAADYFGNTSSKDLSFEILR
ncbi:MAG: hypothetical protein IPI64_14465 [Chloracidobacterium sp.]|nr:hypothetical protein [Chloracidobacterium sp.]